MRALRLLDIMKRVQTHLFLLHAGAQFLIAPNVLPNQSRWQIYVPELATGYVSYINSSGTSVVSVAYNATAHIGKQSK